jgi:hypothetical protein
MRTPQPPLGRRDGPVRTGQSGEGAPDDGLRRPDIDEAKGAEAHGGPRVLRPSIRVVGDVRRDTRCAHTRCANCRGSLPLDSTFVSIMCQTRMVSTGDTEI